MNTISYKSFGTARTVANWRDALAMIQRGRDELSQYAEIMTPYEVTTAQNGINSKVEQYRDIITQGILTEHEQAIENYQRAGEKVQKEISKEINHWDTGRLNDEIRLYETLVKQAISGGANGDVLRGDKTSASTLEALYKEAHDSGDMHKQRAAAEVFKNVLSLVPSGDPARIAANRVVQQAKQDLEGLRSTAGIEQAKQEQGEALNGLYEKREEVRQVSQALGDGDPAGPFAGGAFARALRRIEQDRSTGEVRIHDWDSPEVTRVYEVNKSKAHIAGG
jgi:hypothetical protein